MPPTLQKCFYALIAGLLLFAGVVFSGCDGTGSGDGDYGASGQKPVRGWVFVRDALTGTSITIYDLTGNPLFLGDPGQSDESGTFEIPVLGRPADFRVVVSGGYHDHQSFTGILSADVRGFDPANDYIYINLVTTFISAYLDLHSELTLDEATQRVKRFLAVPDWLDIGRDLESSSSWQYFCPDLFMQAATANGDLDSFIDDLLAEMDGGDAELTHSFAAEGGVGGGGSGAGEFIARSLASGAISYVAGQTLGYGLGELGLFPGDNTEQALQELKQKLETISDQLNDINQKLQHIILQINQANYDIVAGGIKERVSNILKLKDDLFYFYTHTFTTAASREECRLELIYKIETQLIDVGHQSTINDQLVGLIPGETALLKKWSRIVRDDHQFLSNRDYPRLQAHFDFFDAVQAWEMLLLVEYYHATALEHVPYDKDDKFQRIMSTYETNIAEQKKLLLPPVPNLVMIHTEPSPYTGQPIMIFEGEYFTVQDGSGNAKNVKAPMYGTFVDANNRVTQMNNDRWVTYTNWRKIKGGEINNFFKYKPNSLSHPAYLESEGWTPTLRFYLANEEVYDRRGWYCPPGQGCVPADIYHFYMMEIYNAGIWHDVYDNAVHPETQCHWIQVRDMGANELSTYFW